MSSATINNPDDSGCDGSHRCEDAARRILSSNCWPKAWEPFWKGTLEDGDAFTVGRPLGEFVHRSEHRPVYEFLGAQTARF